MKPYLLTFALALLLTSGCSSRQTGRGYNDRPVYVPIGSRATASAIEVLPADDPDGWQLDLYNNPVKYYNRENLYLYLGEKANRVNDYGFVSLEHGVYRASLLAKSSVVVDAFRMDQPLDAYGIYSVECSRSDKILAVGGGGHLGEKESVFWKGSYFVRVKLIGDVDKPEEVLASFANRTAENIQGADALGELAIFPPDGRVPAGDAYYVDNLFGYDFLGRGFTVDYLLAEKKATMFLAIVSPGPEKKIRMRKGMPLPPGSVETAFLKLRRALLMDGETPQVLPGPWDEAYLATHPKLGRGMVARKGNYLVGVFGAPDDQTAMGMTASVVQSLR
jgi:hypothetical protein